MFQDLRSGWSGEVIASDAREWGLGAAISRFDSDVVGRCGRLNERWRFRSGAGHGGARAQAGIETVDGDIFGAEHAGLLDASEAADAPARHRPSAPGLAPVAAAGGSPTGTDRAAVSPPSGPGGGGHDGRAAGWCRRPSPAGVSRRYGRRRAPSPASPAPAAGRSAMATNGRVSPVNSRGGGLGTHSTILVQHVVKKLLLTSKTLIFTILQLCVLDVAVIMPVMTGVGKAFAVMAASVVSPLVASLVSPWWDSPVVDSPVVTALAEGPMSSPKSAIPIGSSGWVSSDVVSSP